MLDHSRAGFFIALGASSFAFALQSLCIWILLAYFQFSVVMALVLLLLGFPLGALVAERFLTDEPAALRPTLLTGACAQLLNLGALVLLQDVAGFLRVGGRTDVTAVMLLAQGAALYVLFLPYFVGWGLVEYQGYRVGRRLLHKGARSVYVLYLAALGCAYVVGRVAVERFGLAHVLVAGVGVGGLAAALMVRARAASVVVSACALVVLCVPGLERRFLELAGGPYYLNALRGERVDFDRGYEILAQRWASSQLFTLMRAPGGDLALGFYNNHLYWVVEHPRLPKPRDAYDLIAPGARIAILGPGGGRQVAQATRLGVGEVHAVEVRSDVVELLTGPWARHVWNAWSAPGVVPVAMDGRLYLERSNLRFDAIALPFTEAATLSTRAIFDVSERLHTLEAFDTYARHLAPGGLLQIKKLHHLDPERILKARYLAALHHLGLTTYALEWSYGWYEILAFREPSPERRATIERTIRSFGPAVRRVERDLHPDVALVYDDNPYPAGVVSTIIKQDALRRTGALLVALLAPVALAAMLVFARRGAADGLSREGWPAGALALAAGMNFVTLESELIHRLTRVMRSPEDALFLGTVGFVACTCLGAILSPRRAIESGAAAASALWFVLHLGEASSTTVELTLLAPALIVSGAFFPGAFEAAAGRTLGVFALDALGASVGGAVSLLVPAAFGVRAHLGAAALIFTAAVVALGWTRVARGAPPELSA